MQAYDYLAQLRTLSDLWYEIRDYDCVQIVADDSETWRAIWERSSGIEAILQNYRPKELPPPLLPQPFTTWCRACDEMIIPGLPHSTHVCPPKLRWWRRFKPIWCNRCDGHHLTWRAMKRCAR